MLNGKFLLFSVLLLLILGDVKVNAVEEIKGKELKNVINSIESYVKQDIKLKGGFYIYDDKENKTLNLKYDHVHEGVKKVDSGEYFACVDFIDGKNNIYDLDFTLIRKTVIAGM